MNISFFIHPIDTGIALKNLRKNLKARIRHLGKLLEGKIMKQKDKYHFVLKKPIEGIAEGQIIVLYNKNKLLGSGEIRIR